MRNISLKRGYTLLEMIVSLGLVSLVMVVVSGAYLTLINVDRQVRATSESAANLSFAMDSMARTIRTGTSYSCGSGDGVCSTLTLVDSQNIPVQYMLKTDNHGHSQLAECNTKGQSCTNSSSEPLTDPRIIIDTLTFVVTGTNANESPNTQPQVLFTIHGTMPTGVIGQAQSATASFTIETSATQRLLDI